MGIAIRSACLAFLVAAIASSAAAAPATAPAEQGFPRIPLPPSPPQFGVVDVSRVVTAMGWAASRQRDQETLKQQLDLELTRFQAEIRKVVEQSRSQVAKAAKLTAEQTEKLARSEDLESLPITPAQRKELMTITARAEQLAAVARDAVRQTLAQRSQALDGLFAEKMLPAVRRAAAARGALGVLRSDQMFYFDRKIDLTDIVIDEATKEAPLTFPPAPRLNFPAVRLDDLVGKAPGK